MPIAEFPRCVTRLCVAIICFAIAASVMSGRSFRLVDARAISNATPIISIVS